MDGRNPGKLPSYKLKHRAAFEAALSQYQAK
jgi:hypothetical protein